MVENPNAFAACHVVNYSDLAKLMAPRPFMVERGHNERRRISGTLQRRGHSIPDRT
jgi:hypothetical protein